MEVDRISGSYEITASRLALSKDASANGDHAWEYVRIGNGDEW